MKKIFTLVFLCTTLFSFSQGIVVRFTNEVVGNNDTVRYVPRFPNADDFIFFDLENTTSQELGIMVTRNVISLAPNALTTFCIGGVCLTGDQSLFPEILAAGASMTHAELGDQAFHITFNPNNNTGISLLKFTLYDETTTSISTSFYLELDNTVSVKEQTSGTTLSAYPNPASDNVTIEHFIPSISSGAQLVIRNIAGVVVHTSSIGQSNKTILSLETFNSGIYFYSIEVNNKSILTKKLIVK